MEKDSKDNDSLAKAHPYLRTDWCDHVWCRSLIDVAGGVGGGSSSKGGGDGSSSKCQYKRADTVSSVWLKLAIPDGERITSLNTLLQNVSFSRKIISGLRYTVIPHVSPSNT